MKKFSIYFVISVILAFACVGHNVNAYLFGACWFNYFVAMIIAIFKFDNLKLK